jgi:hypothetical protein
MDKASQRMFDILAQRVKAKARITYDHERNAARCEWEIGPNAQGYGGYTEHSVCHLNDWFTEDEQMYVIDMLMPAL